MQQHTKSTQSKRGNHTHHAHGSSSRSQQRSPSFVGLPSLSASAVGETSAPLPKSFSPRSTHSSKLSGPREDQPREYATVNSDGTYSSYKWGSSSNTTPSTIKSTLEITQDDEESHQSTGISIPQAIRNLGPEFGCGGSGDSSEPFEQRVSLLTSEIKCVRRMLGKERLRSSIRQLGGMILVLGIGAAYSAFALIAYLLEGKAGYEQIRGFKLPLLVGTLLQVLCGMVSIGTGMTCLMYAPTASRRFHKWSKYFVLIVNLGPISFVITIMRIIMGAKEPPESNQFIPPELNPTQSDIVFAAFMGIGVLISVCATLIGGLTVLGLQLMAFLAQQPHSRGRRYHVIRFAYYNLLVIIGGLSQLALGAYLCLRFGVGPYDKAVHVAAFTIHFPCIAVFVGLLQTIMGVYGWARAVGWCKMVLTDRLNEEELQDSEGRSQNRDHGFQYLVLFTWIVTVYLQFLFQPAYGVADSYDAESATTAAVYLGFFGMAAYLDWLVRVTPVHVDASYYGIDASKVKPFKEDLLVSIVYRKQLAEEAGKVAVSSPADECDTEKHAPSKKSQFRATSQTMTARTTSVCSHDISATGGFEG